MKILMVLERNFPPDIRVEHEIKSLVENGHEVSIACYDQKQAATVEQWNEATIYRKPISNFQHKTSVGCLKFPFYFNFWREFVFDLFERYNFDAIHIHDLPLAQIGLDCKQKYGAKFVLDLHENWPALLEISPHVKSLLGRLLSSNTQWQKYEIEMVQEADDVIVVVEENKKRLQELTDGQSSIHVVSNTPTNSDIKLFQSEKNIPNDELILFYGGGVNEHRGLQNVIKGVSELKELNLNFWVVGDGSYLNTLKELAKSLNISEKVTFWGWKQLAEMMELMMKASVLVIPHKKTNHTETTIPHKLFQYMITEKPILASNCTPIERIINETNSGFIYEHDNIDDLKKNIKDLYNKWNSEQKFEMDGLPFILNKYNWKVDEKELLNIYQIDS